MRKFLKNKLGLSLVELVVTITIMAILAAWLIPSLISSKQDSDMKMDKSAVESLQSAIHIASQDSEIYMKSKVLADSSSNRQIKLVYVPNNEGVLVLNAAYVKDGTKTISSKDPAGEMLREVMTDINNKVNSTMDPVVLKTADAKNQSYCFIISFPDVKFKTNIDFYAAPLEEVNSYWQDLDTEDITPTTPDELPDITAPTEPPSPPPPAKEPGEITKHPVAKTGLVYTGSPQELIVPGSGTGTLYYSIQNASEGFSAEIPTGTNAGTYTVWYYAAATSTHLQSDTYQLTVEIDKASYNVVPPTAQAPVFDGNPHTLISAGSSKYGKMNYKLDNGSWGQALPSATAIGTYKIYYYGTGDANHHPTSKDAYITATISPSKTATYAVSNKVYNNTTYSGVVGENIIITGTNTAKDAGIYTVQVKPQSNYTWADGTNKTLTLTWEIARAKGTCNAPSIKTLNYTGAAQELINPATSATGTVYYKVNSGAWSTTVPKATAAGSYTIYYKMDPTTNYTGIDETLVGTATIGKVNPTVTAPVARPNLQYNGAKQTLITAGSTNGGTMKYSLDNSSYSTSLPQGLNAGTYTVWYYVEGNSNFTTTAKQSIKVTIAQVNPVYTAPKPKTLFYSGSAQQLITAGSNTTPGAFAYKFDSDSAYVNAATSIKGTDAKVYTINWKFTPTDSANYKSTAGTFTVTIQANGLKFNPNGGIVTVSKGYPNNSKTTSLPVPTKSGATFQKWVYDTSEQHLVLDTQFKYTGKLSVHIEAYMDIWDNTDGKRLLSCTNNSGWNFQANGNKITTYFWDNGASAYRQALSSRDWASLSPGWHSFDLIFDGTYGYLYIDGALEGKTAAFTGTLGYPDADNNIIVGAEADGSPKSVQSGIPLFQGKIANVMINNDSTRITNNNCFVVPMSGVTTLTAEWKSAGSCTAPTVKNLTYTGGAQQLVTPASGATGTVYYKIGKNGTWSTSVPIATAVGSYEIYYCVAPTATHTEIKETLAGTARITTATVSITAPTAKTLTYNGSAQTLINAGATSGGTMKYSTTENGTYTTTLPTGTNAGTYTVWYYVDGGSNFTTTSKQSVSVTINKVTPSVTAPTAKSLAYTGGAQALVNAGKTNYGTMKYSTSENGTYSTTIPTGIGAGSYTVWYFVEGNSNVNSTAKKSVSVTIGKVNPTVTAPTAKTGLKYNGNNQQLVNAGSTNGGTMMYSTSENGTYSTTIPTGKNAGSYTVWWYVNGGTSYNSTTKKSISITIAKATPTYTAPAAKTGLTYNNTAQALVTAGSNTTAGSFTYKLSTASSYGTSIPKGTAAQSYTVNWKFTPTDTTNYNSASGSITVSIGGAPAVDKAYTFNYTGSVQTFTAPVAGYYNLQVWGAQGGRSLADGSIKDTGGLGGYSSGDVYLEAGETIYIAVGGKGADPVQGTDSAGGWNGGGNSTHDHSDDEVAGAGGGATSITNGTKRGDGQLKNYSSYKSQVLIVAGGGGGGEWTYTDSAGVGGGLKGGLGRGCLNMSAASQTSGYAFGQGGAGIWNSSWGANAAADGLAGGGGGYYGGYGSSSNDNYASSSNPTSSAGGGSSYIDGVLNGITTSGVQAGNGKAVVTYRGTSKPSSGTTSSTPTVYTYGYTGAQQTFTAPVAGYYFVETWGAQGGSKYGTGGFGGYSNGYVYLNKGEKLYVYVGQHPTTDTAGWNGGGAGYSAGGASVYYAAGGGASDIRKGGTALSNRIIVAGGGGGGAHYSTDILGGTGGGLTTGNVYYANYGGVMTKSGNIGATINNGGTAAVDGAAPGGYMPGVTSGTLGQGAPSGGGGYYGGPQYSCGNRVYAGGGGSGYIGGVLNGMSSAGVNEGHGKVTITLSQDAGASVLPNTRWTYNYTGGSQTFIAPASGYYQLYAYGASGGTAINNSDSSMYGYGAMMRGVIWFEKGQTIYVYVGQAGTYSTGSGNTGGTAAPATFNGGGDGGGTYMPNQGGHLGGSGGGATDFRLINGAWNNAEGLKSRILVAGGGGGQGCASSHNRGHGGSTEGVTTTNTGYYYGSSSTGGTQTAGGYGNGITTTDGSTWNTARSQGGFGYGANACQCAAGGGGGWYGGGSNYTAGGGGGSSFCAGIAGYTTEYSEYRNGLKFVEYGVLTGTQNGNGYATIEYLGPTY
ncbi:MAG: hypothetical protein IJ419_13620 [Agathobacter sp.]|nr:hypothetical protein [Agathobacter sp.]